MEEIPKSWLIATVVTVALVSFVFIIWFFAFPPDAVSDKTSDIRQSGPFISTSPASDKDTRPVIVRVLRYNETSLMYRFTDHELSLGDMLMLTDDLSNQIPIPTDGGPVAPAMIQVIRGGENDRTIEQTRFILPVDDVQEILNRYSLYGLVTPTPTQPLPIPTVRPKAVTKKHMIIPITEYVCNNNDASCTVHFSYISRYDTAVMVPAGPDNYISLPPENRGQPEIFYPGYQYDVFTARWPANSTSIVWYLTGEEALAEPVSVLQPRIHAEPQDGFIPLTVTLTDYITGVGEKNSFSYHWDFGDKKSSDTKDTIHTYRFPGQYTVNHTVTSRCGTVSSTLIVQAYDAAFSWEPDIKDPLVIRFSDNTMGISDTWFWEFGSQDETSFEQNPIHTFPSPGAYPVALTVHIGNNAKKIVTMVQAG